MAYEFNSSIGHLEGLESPWGNAGGVVKTVHDVEAMAKTGVGWIEAGSYTLEQRWGNAAELGDDGLPIPGVQKTVYYHDPVTGETTNSLGMPNMGFDTLEEELPEMIEIAHAYNKQFVLNVAPVTAEPVAEVQELVQRASEAGVDAVLVNAGCPNVVLEDGGRKELLSRNPEKLAVVLSGLMFASYPNKPIWVRISPQETYAQAQEIFGVIKDSSVVSAVVDPNTWPNFVPVDEGGNAILEVPGGAGGRSGPATADESAEQTAWGVELLQGSGIDLVSSSGIMNARELARRLGQGAAGGAGTTFYYESVEGWADDTNKMLRELAS